MFQNLSILNRNLAAPSLHDQPSQKPGKQARKQASDKLFFMAECLSCEYRAADSTWHKLRLKITFFSGHTAIHPVTFTQIVLKREWIETKDGIKHKNSSRLLVKQAWATTKLWIIQLLVSGILWMVDWLPYLNMMQIFCFKHHITWLILVFLRLDELIFFYH